LKDYVLAALGGVWLADGMALLVAPRYIITQVRNLVHQSPAVLRWEFLTIIGGVFLFFGAPEFPYQSLWMVTAGGMIAKEPSCRSDRIRGVDRSSIGVLAEKTWTTDSGVLVSVRLRSCYSMR
jgi:hypothetical protein